MSKKYYWLKLKKDFFKSKVMKKIRTIAGGDTFTIIYLKMQLLSIEKEGKIIFEGIEETFEQEISLELDENVDNVKMTLAFLRSYGLIETCDDKEYFLPEANDSIGSEVDSAERVRRFRGKENQYKTLQCNADVTKCNTEKEKEKEKEKDIMCGKPHHIDFFDKNLEEKKEKESNIKKVFKYNGVEIKEPNFDVYDKEFDFSEYEVFADIKLTKTGRLIEILSMVVLKHFNWVTNSRFRPVKANISMIKNILGSGVTIVDCFQVNARMHGKWGNDPNMSKYLRVKTLYSTKNFEQYLGEIKTNKERRKKVGSNE